MVDGFNNYFSNYLKNFRRVSYFTKEGIIIWHVLFCKEQREYETLEICKAKISRKVFKKSFILTYDRMRRYEGVWHIERKILFPACVFLESEDRKFLSEEVKKCFGSCENRLFTLDCETESLLKKICGESGNLSMSKGIIHKGVPQIVEGPLKGMEDRICKIDRHKRLATVAAVNLTESQSQRWITAGLEIIEKII